MKLRTMNIETFRDSVSSLRSEPSEVLIVNGCEGEKMDGIPTGKITHMR
jgi:hypothetical protein